MRNSPNPRDEEWHMGTLSEYELSNQVIPTILEIQNERLNAGSKPLTIREAYWASNLIHVIKKPKLESHTRNDLLRYWARIYAFEEKIAEIMKTKLVTTNLDQIIIGHAEAYSNGTPYWNWVLQEQGIDEVKRQMTEFFDAHCYLHELNKKEQLTEEEIEQKKLQYATFMSYIKRREGYIPDAESATEIELERFRVYCSGLYEQYYNETEPTKIYKEGTNERPHNKEG